MISLNISEEILVKHIKYLLGNGLEERIRDLITDDIVNHIGDKLGADVADEHKRFVKFILNEINALKEKKICDLNDNLFVGNFNALNTVIKFVSQGFPNIDASIRGQKQIYKNKNYQEILLDAFGYEKFSQEPLAIFYNKECEFIKKVTKKYLKILLEETQGDHKEVIKLLIEDLNKAYIEGDFIISEIMFILKDRLQEILNTEYTNKNKFINDVFYIYASARELVEARINSDVLNIITYKEYKKRYDTWSAYDFVMELGIKVCPYCNMNYVVPIYGIKGKARADLDHFYAKHIYPYLSMSIYNLVPACKVCNSSFKRGKEFNSSNISVYEKDLEELYRFTYYPIEYDSFIGDGDVDIEIEYCKSENARKVMNNQRALNVKEVYQYHTTIVKDYIKKRQIYDEAYIEDIYARYSNLFSSKQEVLECLFDIGSDIKNQPLGKFRTDIAKELGLIDF